MHNLNPILLVEDDTVDAMTVKRAMRDLAVLNSLVHVINGEEALKYLKDSSSVRPCVILLDLNMPKMNGVEFLRAVKGDNELKGIPIIVLTTSKADQDKIDCFNNSVAGYIVKPNNYEDFVWAMKVTNLYWTISEIPCGGDKTSEVAEPAEKSEKK